MRLLCQGSGARDERCGKTGAGSRLIAVRAVQVAEDIITLCCCVDLAQESFAATHRYQIRLESIIARCGAERREKCQLIECDFFFLDSRWIDEYRPSPIGVYERLERDSIV